MDLKLIIKNLPKEDKLYVKQIPDGEPIEISQTLFHQLQLEIYRGNINPDEVEFFTEKGVIQFVRDDNEYGDVHYELPNINDVYNVFNLNMEAIFEINNIIHKTEFMKHEK